MWWYPRSEGIRVTMSSAFLIRQLSGTTLSASATFTSESELNLWTHGSLLWTRDVVLDHMIQSGALLMFQYGREGQVSR